MTELAWLLAELTCGEDGRAEQAAAQIPACGAEGLAALKVLLQAPEADQRWWAVRALAGFEQADELLPDLTAALEDESEEVRQAAAMAFCHQPYPQAIAPLIQALSDPDPLTARLAATALSLIGSGATPSLLEVLKTGSAPAKREAVRALAEIQDPQAIPGLLQALETDSALLQYWASQGLEKLGVGMVYLKPD